MNGLAPKTGIRDGLPIALGYFAVSIAFGVATVGYGFPVWTPILISLTNFTGSGQALGVQLLASGTATLAELLVAMIARHLFRYFRRRERASFRVLDLPQHIRAAV